MKAVHFAGFVNATPVDNESGKKLGVFDLRADSSDIKLLHKFEEGSESDHPKHRVTHDSGAGLPLRIEHDDFGDSGLVGVSMGFGRSVEMDAAVDEDTKWWGGLAGDQRRLQDISSDPSEGPGGVVSSG